MTQSLQWVDKAILPQMTRDTVSWHRMTKCLVISRLVIKPPSRLSSDAEITTHIATWRGNAEADEDTTTMGFLATLRSELDKSLQRYVLSSAENVQWEPVHGRASWHRTHVARPSLLLQMSALCVCWGHHLYQRVVCWVVCTEHLSAVHTTRIPTGKVKVGSPAVKCLIRPPDKFRMRYVTHSLLQHISHHFCDEYSDHRKYLSRLLRDTGQRPDDRRDSSHNIFSHNYTFPDPWML